MGIKNMLKFLNTNYPELIKKININNFQGEKIAIDISILLYQVIIAIRNSGSDMTNQQGDVTSHILGLFNKTILLLKKNILPIYVFDGPAPAFKLKVLQNRKIIKQRAIDKLNDNDLSESDKIKYFKRTVSISKKQIEECKELLTLMGIPYVVAPEEADSQCAQLVKEGHATGVLTEDMDILTFGANTIYRNLVSYKKEQIKIDLPEILNKLDLTYEQFVELCILFGCDYTEKLLDISPNTIYEYFHKHKNMKDTLLSIYKTKIIQNYKNENEINTICNSYNMYKNYFINPPVHCNTNIQFNKPNINELTTLLVSKYGLIRIKIQSKLSFLANMNKKELIQSL
jgi:flap endonuclease-1